MRIVYRGRPPVFKSQGIKFVRDAPQIERERVVSDEWWDNLSDHSKTFFEILSIEDMDETEKLSQELPTFPAFPILGFRTKKSVQEFVIKHLDVGPRSNEYKAKFDTKFALKTLQHNALDKYCEVYGKPNFLKTTEELNHDAELHKSQQETVLIKRNKGVKIDSAISNQALKKKKVQV